ncbi:uncharacterized protein LOC126849358 [Cataglyphis hispanica]|uniref:uncharacterized protein LOC126849358 n=1 Tax=Cataglyphis hispanica TaxID=1086592 RepID=UPI0021805240|nr:uncharacterized protein LOC126849358 [Cataglyphis hispanica]
MFWCYKFFSFLLLFGNVAYGETLKSRVRRQDSFAQSGQLIDNIFNIPITAIKQTAAVAHVFSPENTQTIDNIVKIPVSTLEAVGTLVKTTTEQRQQNAERIRNNRQERRERLMAIKEQKRKRKQEIQDQRTQLTRIVRHYKDPFGLNAWSNLLFGHHSRLGGRLHGGNGLHGHGIHGSHGGLLGNRPQHMYEVHEDINEDTSFSWHGLTAGFGSFHGTRPSSTAIKIENKIAPQEERQKTSKYPIVDVNSQNKITKIRNKLLHEYHDDSPIENKIAPRNGKVSFVR